MPKTRDLIGITFGRLTVIEWAGRDRGNHAWKCLCECGNYIVARSGPLGAGVTKSCGCLAREQRQQFKIEAKTHGNSQTATYGAWSRMKSKCQNDKNPRYRDYGGRGITVCERWNDSFENFLADMGDKPAGTGLGRIDKSKGYAPENCKWMTSFELKEGKRTPPPSSEWNRQPLPDQCINGHDYPPYNDKGKRRGCTICAKEQQLREYEPIRKNKAIELKREVMEAYGGHCTCCGETRIEFLSIDHIFNDGAEHRRKTGEVGALLYSKLKRDGYPKGRLQVLCYNCNGAKGFYGYCPHITCAQEIFGFEVSKERVIRNRLTNKQKEKPQIIKARYRRGMSEKKEQEIAERYLRGGISMAKVGIEYGVSINVVHRAVHEMTGKIVDVAVH